MAQYPIKLMKDESGQPFVPLTSIKAVVGEEYIQTALLAEQVSTGHFIITNDKITDSDILNKIVAVSFPDEITATTNSYLKINEGNEYLIYDEDGTGPLLIKDFAHVICFLMRKEDRWQLIKTGAAATTASGGHTIVDNDGNVMPQQKVLQFKGFGVSDNAGTGATVISTPALVNNLSTTESGTGPLDAYQGKVLNDKLDSSLQNYLPLVGGSISGHVRLTGVNATSGIASTSKIIFSDGTTDYTNIYSSQSGLYIGNSLTDGSKNMGYDGSANAWRPASANSTASLGTSGNKWSKLFVTTGQFNTLTLPGATTEVMTFASTNPKITFSESGIQPVSLIYSDYDSYRAPAGLKVIGEENGCWFEADGEMYAAGGNKVLHAGNYSSYALPKSGGKMTGNIGYANGDYSDYDMIKWKTGDNNGAGIVIGGGGAVVIGGGESADRVYSGQSLTGGSEVMYLCNDQGIEFYPGQQSAYTAAGKFAIAAGGTVTKCNGVNVPGVFVQSGTPTAKQTGDIWFKV